MTLTEKLYLLLIFSLPIVRPFALDVSGLVVPATDLIFVGVAVGWGVGVARGRRPVVWTWYYVLLACYLLALAASIVASGHERASPMKLLGTAYLVSLSALTVNLVRSWAYLRTVFMAWLAGTAVTVVIAVLCVVFYYAGWTDLAEVFGLTHFGSLPPGPYPRITALFRNMNMLCNYLIPSLLIVLTMQALGWLTPAWSRPFTAGIWVAAIFTASAGLGGMLPAAMEWRRLRAPAAMRGSIRVLWHGAMILVAAAPLLLAVALPTSRMGPDRILVPGTGIALEPAPRLFLWRGAFETFLAHPLFGQGLRTPVASYDFVTLAGEPQHLTDAHNVWLSLAGQGGLLTLAAFGAIVVWLARRCLTDWGGDRPAALVRTGLGLSLAAALGYHGLTGSFEDARHLWVVAGLVVALSRGLEGAPAPLPRQPQSGPVTSRAEETQRLS